MSRYNVVIFGSVDWSEHWQMHHQLAISNANDGHRVLYVDNTGVRPPSLVRDRRRVARKAREVLTSAYGFRVVDDHITILSPLLLPHPYNPLAVNFNRLLITSKIKQWASVSEFSRFPLIVFTFLPTPLIYKTCQCLNPSVLVYYCANDMAGKDALKAPLIPWENKFFREADLVFTISSELTKKAQLFRDAIYEYPPGLDNKFISMQHAFLSDPADLSHIPSPRICFVGTLAPVDNRFDLELFLQITRENRDLSFVLVGPSYGDISLIKAEANVYIVGPKPHSEVISYLSAADVAIIPYRVNSYTASVNTCKLNEYLSVGLPVVSTPLAEILRVTRVNPDLLYIASNPEQFGKAIRLALSEWQRANRNNLRNSRIDYARSNSWDLRYKNIVANVSAKLTCNSHGLAASAGQSRLLLARIKFRRNRLLLFFSVVLLVYWAVFISPIISSVSYVLSPRESLGRPSLVLVLTGDGAGSYYNDSFLNRAKDVLLVYQKRPDVKIVISTSRNRLIPEVDVLRDYLVARGIPAARVSVLTPNASNTWEHLLAVHRYVPSSDMNSVVLLSSPLHARRAAAMLRKISPHSTTVMAPAVVDTPHTPWRWGSSWTEVRVTAYELAAYIYAWLQGRV